MITTTRPNIERSAAGVRVALLVGVGIVLVALNLRLGISTASALLETLRIDLGFGAAVATAMAVLPTLSFAAAGIATGRLAGRWGNERTMLVAVVALTLGLTLRAVPATWALLAGTVIAMSGLALCNVLLPTVLRAHFPVRVGLLTGVYTTVMALGATLGAATAVPVAEFVGSPSLGLAFWALPALAAVLVWTFIPNRSRESDSASAQDEYISPLAMARTRLGVLVTAYFALQALNCYSVIAWLPTLLSDQGMSRGAAGAMLAITQGVGIPATFLVLAYSRRPGRVRSAFIMISVAMLAGFAGLLAAPVAMPVLWAILVGLGLCSFPLVLAVIGNSGTSSAETTALSSLSQSLGYLVAALGPLAVGLLHGLTGAWTVPMLLLLVTAGAQLVVGIALSESGDRQGGLG